MVTPVQIRTINKQLNTIFGVSYFPSEFIANLPELREIFLSAAQPTIDSSVVSKMDDIKHISSSGAAWIREKALGEANGYIGMFESMLNVYKDENIKVDVVRQVIQKAIEWSSKIFENEDVKEWLQEKTPDLSIGGVHFRIWSIWALVACGLITSSNRIMSHAVSKNRKTESEERSSNEVTLFGEKEMSMLKFDSDDILDDVRNILASANEQCAEFISSWEEMPEDTGKDPYSQTVALLMVALISSMTILVFDWILVEGTTE